MVHFKILSGKKAGATWVARHFPVRIGRAPTCDLQLEEHGVWNEHFRVEFHPDAKPLAFLAGPERAVEREHPGLEFLERHPEINPTDNQELLCILEQTASLTGE